MKEQICDTWRGSSKIWWEVTERREVRKQVSPGNEEGRGRTESKELHVDKPGKFQTDVPKAAVCVLAPAGNHATSP